MYNLKAKQQVHIYRTSTSFAPLFIFQETIAKPSTSFGVQRMVPPPPPQPFIPVSSNVIELIGGQRQIRNIEF